jgi:hypothetical protein
MVDFNNDTTVGTPAVDVERISILQRRYDVIEALEDYKKKRMMGSESPISFVRARLFSLFVELQAYLKRKLSEKDYNDLLNTCLNDNNEDNLVKAMFRINEELDSLRLIKVDTHIAYDATNVEEESRVKKF